MISQRMLKIISEADPSNIEPPHKMPGQAQTDLDTDCLRACPTGCYQAKSYIYRLNYPLESVSSSRELRLADFPQRPHRQAHRSTASERDIGGYARCTRPENMEEESCIRHILK